MDINNFFVHIHIVKMHKNSWKCSFFNFFRSYSALLKESTFWTFHRWMSDFSYWFSHKFWSFFIKKSIFFGENLWYLVVFTIDNRFFGSKSSRKARTAVCFFCFLKSPGFLKFIKFRHRQVLKRLQNSETSYNTHVIGLGPWHFVDFVLLPGVSKFSR